MGKIKMLQKNVARGDGGFTLVELMIAAAIMTGGLVVLLGALTSVVDTGELSAARAEATAQLTSLMEELRGLTYDQLLSYQPPDLTGIGSDCVVTVRCYDGDGQACDLPLTADATAPVLPNPAEVQVIIGWRDAKGRAYTLQASTRHKR